MKSKRKIMFGAIIVVTALLFTTSRGDVLCPLQPGEVLEFIVTDSGDPGNPWTVEWHVLEIVDIDGDGYYAGTLPFYPLSIYDHKTDEWETGVVFVNSDEEHFYKWDEDVYEVWPITAMVPEHVVVPYGVFDAYYYDEGNWYNYFVPGVGYIKWIQFEIGYTITGELVDIYMPTLLEEQINQILYFVDDSIEDGALTGDGPGKSADNRLNALTNMLEEAQSLIEAEMYEEALEQLESIYKHVDGESPPKDFVKGEAAAGLAAMIQDLVESILDVM